MGLLGKCYVLVIMDEVKDLHSVRFFAALRMTSVNGCLVHYFQYCI